MPAVIFICLCLQCVFAPMIVASKGRDGWVWFFISVMWVMAFGAGVSLFGWGVIHAVTDAESLDDRLFAGAVAAGTFTLGFMPTLVSIVMRNKDRAMFDHSRRRSRRRRR